MLIYGIPIQIREHGMLNPLWRQGNHIHRVGFGGQEMNLFENIAETTGISLSVHDVIFLDATGFSVSDGQKHIVASLKRAIRIFRERWKPSSRSRAARAAPRLIQAWTEAV